MHNRQSPDPPKDSPSLQSRYTGTRPRRPEFRSNSKRALRMVEDPLALVALGGEFFEERFQQDGGAGVGGAGGAVAEDVHC